jgi:hypothetical protein
MSMFHQVRNPLIAIVAAVTLMFAAHAMRDAATPDAGQSVSAAGAGQVGERPADSRNEAAARSDGSSVAVVQLQSDLDLVGASIGAYDR